VSEAEEFRTANAGFRYDYQFVEVGDYHGRGEAEPTPHFLQNLGEAEYAVAIYQYMRLLGYPARKVTILATYAGQRALIMDVLAHRCAKHPAFGMPGAVATVDKYQGEQNDCKLPYFIFCPFFFHKKGAETKLHNVRSSANARGTLHKIDIILSLTRTRKVGYLRDVRRMTVALSRARLGLYVLGRREIFEACHELRPAFEQLLARPTKLALVTGELWPSKRVLAEEETVAGEGAQAGAAAAGGEAIMEGVEHLGQYVFEMTKTKMKELSGEGNAMVVEGGEEEEQEEVVDRVVEEDEEEADGVAAPEKEDEEEEKEEEDGEEEQDAAGEKEDEVEE